MFGTDLKGNFVYFNNGLVDVTEENDQMMRNYFNSLGKKEQLLKAKGMAMINKATKSVMSYFNAT